MGMVMALLLVFLVAGAYLKRIDRWVMAGLTGVIALVLGVTYLRF